MKEQDSIISSKVKRAAKLAGTGVKIGGNYIKYYAQKTIDSNYSKDKLHEENANDIYKSLSQLKGSALKVAQMLSMDKNLLPAAYNKQFAQSQYSAPPLSAPLVLKTFTQYVGKSPNDVFEKFNLHSSAAASIGQVHQAEIAGKKLAVKIQYPGVADAIHSDLAMVKPIANRMFGLSEKEMAQYFEEVESKLIEETDYTLELKRSIELSEKCNHIPNVFFAKYYPEFSGPKVLTMDWIEGNHLNEFLALNPNQETKNTIAQALWDFYEFQLHELKAIHADPHPGNFIINSNNKVGIIDFGCVKEVPTEFYFYYFPLLLEDMRNNPAIAKQILSYLKIIHETDSKETTEQLSNAFLNMTGLLSRPFNSDTFTFTDAYIQEIYALGQEIYKLEEVKKPTQARGAKDALYINRTYFGLYSMLADLKATIHSKPKNWDTNLRKHWNC